MMQAYWDFLLSALQSQFGPQLGLLIAWLFCASMFLMVAAPVYMVMKSTTKFRGGRDLDMEAIRGVQNPTVMSQPATDLLANANPTASYPTIAPPSGAPEVQSRIEINSASSSREMRRNPAAVSAFLVIAVVMMMVAGTIFAGFTKSPNAMVLMPFLFAVFAMFFLRRAMRVRLSAKRGTNPSATIRGNVTKGESLVVKLDKDSIQKARLLLSTGKDLESVCSELEPGYPNWGYIQQQMFRKAMERVLKSKSLG
jgi:hypothetical protein